MRWLTVLVSLLHTFLGFVDGLSGSEACQFVGARLFKNRVTQCSRNMCFTGSVLDEAISCDEAREIAQEIMSSAFPDARGTKRRKLNESPIPRVTELFQTVLVPAVEDVLYRRSRISDAAIQAMAEVDRMILQAAYTRASFKRSEIEWLRIESARKFIRIVMEILEDRSPGYASADSRSWTQGPLVNFLMDMLSFGLWRSGPLFLMGSSDVASFAHSARLGYREAYLREKRVELLPLSAMSQSWYLSVSQAISILNRLTIGAPGAKLTVALARELEVFLTRDPPGDANQFSAWALLEDQMVHELCSVDRFHVTRGLIRISNSLHGPTNVAGRGAARVLKLCRSMDSGIVSDSTWAASAVVTQSERDRDRRHSNLILPDPTNSAAVVEFIYTSSWDWIGTPNGTSDTVLTLIDMLMDGRLPKKVVSFGSSKQDEENWFPQPMKDGVIGSRSELGGGFDFTMRTLGRLLAIACKLGGRLSRFGFPEMFVKALFEDGPVGDDITRDMAESAHYARLGAIDVLGFLGFRVMGARVFYEKFL